MPPRRNPEPPIQLKVFRDVDEIDHGIAELQRRRADVDSLNPAVHRHDGRERANFESAIRNSILKIFGPKSPQYIEHGMHQIMHDSGFAVGEDGEWQDDFARGIPESRLMLDGLIKHLEEERAHFRPPRSEPAETSPPARHTFTIERVGQLSLGDINNITIQNFFAETAKAVEARTDIAPEEKKSILERLSALAKNPWVVNIGSEVIKTAIRGAMGA